MYYKKILDIVGLSGATICLIHCMAFPLLTVIPVIGLHNHWFDFVFACIGLWAVIKISGAKKFSESTSKILWFSILVVIGCVVLEFVTLRHSYLMYLGATGLITGHTLNYFNHKHTADERN